MTALLGVLLGVACVPASDEPPSPPPALPRPPAPSSASPQRDEGRDPADGPIPAPQPTPAPPAEPTCRALAAGGSATPVPSRRLRRYPSDAFAIGGVWSDVSLRRVRDHLRVRWWLPERDCRLATELIRVDDVVVLQETPEPHSRCAVVGATLVETRVPLEARDARVCVPGHDLPIALVDLARWSDEPTPPARGGPEAIDPWAD